MKRRNLLACGISVLMAASLLAGCGGNGEETTGAASGSAAAQSEAASENAEAQSRDAQGGAVSADGEPVKVGILQHMDHPSLNQIYETIVEEMQPLVDEG